MDQLTGEDRMLAAQREKAQAAARLGADFIEATRTGHTEWLEQLVVPDSSAALQLELFGPDLFKIALRLDDTREQGRLRPYDFQFEREAGLLELGVIEPLPDGEGHVRRIYGNSLLLLANGPEDWLVADLVPVNTNGQLNHDDPADRLILETYRGERVLPPVEDGLDPVEQLFLTTMPDEPGRFNLDEMLNAVRLWRDYRQHGPFVLSRNEKALAAAVEYLITLFDYFRVDQAKLARRYGTSVQALLAQAREIARALNATQFDDRYSIHLDPIAHYREVFRDIGGLLDKEEMEKARREQSKIFDSVEVPPDDEDFFGPY